MCSYVGSNRISSLLAPLFPSAFRKYIKKSCPNVFVSLLTLQIKQLASNKQQALSFIVQSFKSALARLQIMGNCFMISIKELSFPAFFTSSTEDLRQLCLLERRHVMCDKGNLKPADTDVFPVVASLDPKSYFSGGEKRRPEYVCVRRLNNLENW